MVMWQSCHYSCGVMKRKGIVVLMVVMWQSCEIIILWLQVIVMWMMITRLDISCPLLLRPRNSHPPHTYIITYTHTPCPLFLFKSGFPQPCCLLVPCCLFPSNVQPSLKGLHLCDNNRTPTSQPLPRGGIDFTMTIHTLANRVYNDLWWQGIRLCPLKTCAHGETIGCQSTRKLRQWLPQYQ